MPLRQADSTANTRLEMPRYTELLARFPSRITEEQIALAGKYWGFDDTKTAIEIRELAAEAASRYRRGLWKRRLGPLGRWIRH